MGIQRIKKGGGVGRRGKNWPLLNVYTFHENSVQPHSIVWLKLTIFSETSVMCEVAMSLVVSRICNFITWNPKFHHLACFIHIIYFPVNHLNFITNILSSKMFSHQNFLCTCCLQHLEPFFWLLVECYFIVGFRVNNIYSGPWG